MSTLPSRCRTVYLVGPKALELREVPLPRPGPGALLLRVDAATTCGTDLKVWRWGGHATMLAPPCPFGHEVAGTVAAVGPGVGPWSEGDRVMVANSASCGACAACRSGRENLCRELVYLNGAYSEYLLVPQRFVDRSTYRLPAGLDPVTAALAEPLACVLHGVSACPDDAPDVIVLGGGPIGLMFVGELARQGRRVVLADPVAARREAGLGLGAAAAVAVEGGPGDAARLRAELDPQGSNLVVEATGDPVAWETALASLAPGGTVVLFGGCPPGTSVGLDTGRLHYDEVTIKGVYHHRPETVAAAIGRLASGSPPFRNLVQAEYRLDQVEVALRRMAAREILKAAIIP